MSPFDAVALGLATFYAAYVIARTAGPLNAFKRLRGARAIGPLATCFYCVAVYAAIGAYVLLLVLPPALYVLAAAGAAAFLYRYTGADLS